MLLTTTTKVQNPFPIPVDWFISERDPEKRKRELLSRIKPKSLGLVVNGPFGAHKWDGISKEVVDNIFTLIPGGIILNEADGAYRLPIKTPAANVIPSSTTVLIPILGLSALGAPLNKTHAFRPQLIAKVTGLSMGDRITKRSMATLFAHPEGITKGVREAVPIFPFLNQADKPELMEAGKEIAEEIFMETTRIDTVLIGRLKPVPLFEVCHRKRVESKG